MFNGVWTDLALEKTYNNQGKSILFKGISQAPSAREKYIKSLPMMTKISESTKSMAELTTSVPQHHANSKQALIKNI